MKFKERPKGPSSFLKIASGESVKGILRGEPFDYFKHWVGSKSEVCLPENCSHCLAGVKRTFAFRANILINENNSYVCKIFEQGGPVYDQLKALSEDYDLEKTVVKITRTGEKMQTKYSIIPLPGIIGDEKFKDIPLHDLSKFEKEADEDGPKPENLDEVPF